MKEVIIFVALLISVGLLWKPLKRVILGGLDGRIDRIRRDLEEAQRLREEAQALLADYKRRHREAMREAEAIVEHAKSEAGILREQAQIELQHRLERREQAALDKISQAEAQALVEVRGLAVEVAVAATRRALSAKIDARRGNALIERAIEDLPARLN